MGRLVGLRVLPDVVAAIDHFATADLLGAREGLLNNIPYIQSKIHVFDLKACSILHAHTHMTPEPNLKVLVDISDETIVLPCCGSTIHDLPSGPTGDLTPSKSSVPIYYPESYA